MQFYITGDTHRRDICSRVHKIIDRGNVNLKEDLGIIVLGDLGLNYYLNNADRLAKNVVEIMLANIHKNTYIYAVRGNHEQRPELIKGMQKFYDSNVNGEIFAEKEYPHIRYLIDGSFYCFNGHTALVCGGAYSIDKKYRLSQSEPWFEEEQLSHQEQQVILNNIQNKTVEFVLSHTCPYEWMPTDLFLSCYQGEEDTSMEKWLSLVRDNIKWEKWCFGHFHDNRTVLPNVYLFFDDFNNIDWM